jgi:hypothetical protein
MIVQFVEFTSFAYILFRLTNECTRHRAVDYIRAMFTLTFASLWIYLMHRHQHKYPDGVFGKIHAMHHNPKHKNEWYAHALECLNNSQLLLFILFNKLIKKMTNVELFSNHILVLLTVMYLFVHFVQYKVFKSCKHAIHHEHDNDAIQHYELIKNYEPYIFDNLFETQSHCKPDQVPSWYLYVLIILVRTCILYYVTVAICKTFL